MEVEAAVAALNRIVTQCTDGRNDALLQPGCSEAVRATTAKR